jgi:hypothetical protein
MPEKKQDAWQIVRVRLPHELLRRLDRYLDWRELYRGDKSSRNAVMRESLQSWLDEHEQLAGFLEPQAQREQFQAAYESVTKRHGWVAIHRLRHRLPWPRERFDTVLEGLRADHQVELENSESSDLSPQAIQDSSHGHGPLYVRLRWRS